MPASFFSGLRNLSARLLAVGTICTCTTSLTHAQITVTRDKGGFNFTAYDGPAPQSTGVIMIPTHTFVGIGGEERLNIDWLAINIRWGILFGEIVEDYAVEWASHPNIPFVAMTEGQRMAYRREDFAFYHDLVARIAQLRPKAIEFVITFSVADAGGKIHRGSTLVPAVMTLFAGSGKRPFHVPSIRPVGKFLQDGPLKNDYPDVLKVLPSARSLTIESVTITRLEWPVSEMRAILAQRAAYLKEPHDEKTEDLIEEEWAKAEDQAAAQAAADEKKHAELKTLSENFERQLVTQSEGRSINLPQHQPQQENGPATPQSAQVTAEIQQATAGNPLSSAAYTIPQLGLEMVRIEPGTFQMGSDNGRDDEKPVTTVRITHPYLIGKYEVTQDQWRAVMESTPSQLQGGNYPVVQVSWNQVAEFCRKLTARERTEGRLPDGYAYTLPTEAQWEYACRAGTTGDYAGTINDMGWSIFNANQEIKPVGHKQANAWGLYDMHGNVAEWCSDWFGPYPGGTLTDPTGLRSGAYRVVRGGSAFIAPFGCRSAFRDNYEPDAPLWHAGFRLALTLTR